MRKITTLYLVVAILLAPSLGSAITLDQPTYDAGEAILVTCSASDNTFQIFDNTPGLSSNWGNHNCGDSAVEAAVTTEAGHTYTFVELSAGSSCDAHNYEGCLGQSFFVGKIEITISGSISSGFHTNKTSYSPDETIFVTCSAFTNTFQLYNMNEGADSISDDLGNFTCDIPTALTDNSLGTYAVMELDAGGYCDGLSYNACKEQSFFLAEASFEVRLPGGGATLYTPEVVLSGFTGTKFFSREASVTYAATDDNDNSAQKSQYGLSATPVSIYLIDSITDKFYGPVPSSYKVLLAKDQPARATFKWNVSTLIPGVPYRFVINAIDNFGFLGEAVSDNFYVDFSAPEFTVSVNPSATRGAPVTISVDSSEELKGLPKVLVTQEGRVAGTVEMKGEGNHFEGIYTPIQGYDGIAKISVTGTDLGGNAGDVLLSGGTFAVGVNPPPTPKITFPRNNDVTKVGTTTISGTTRADTMITLTVNGADISTVKPDSTGAFTIPDIRLSKDKSRGINTLSVVAKDSIGIVSSAGVIRVRYNVAPTIRFVAPKADATVNGTTVLAATSSDENLDLLKYTYQIIQAKEFDARQSATSSANAWMTIGESGSEKLVWDTTEVEDGAYFARIIVDDGVEKAYSGASRFTIRNTLPFFRFTNGRRTVVKGSPVTVSGRAIAPDISPRPTIARVEYSIDAGKTWKNAEITGVRTTEASFSVTFFQEAEGTYPVLWRARDSRNLSGRTMHAIVIDATPPAAPRITVPRAGVVISSAQDENTIQDGTQVTLSGTAEPLSTVTLAAATSTRTAAASIDGAFSFKGITLDHGANRFSVSATDLAGNRSASQDASIIQDDAPEITILEPKSERGLKGNARISWRVTDPDGDSVRVALHYRRGNGTLVTLPVDPNATHYDWDLTGFAEAADYELVFSAYDALATSTEGIGFSIDVTPPILRSFLMTSDRIGKNGILKASGEAEDALSGIAYVEYLVKEKDASESGLEWLLGTITRGFLASKASYTISRETRLDDGSYEIVARAVDAAGNVSPILSNAVVVDTSPPHIGSFSLIESDVRLSPDADGKLEIYANHASRFAISLEGDTKSAELHVGETLVPLSLDIASGLWEGMLPPLASGATLSVNATDELGNATDEKEIGALGVIARGLVRDDAGNALASVPIEVFVYDDVHTSYLASGTTIESASDGSYELTLAQGKYELRARLTGYRTAIQQLSLQRSAFVNTSFALEEFTGVRGFFERIIEYWRDR